MPNALSRYFGLIEYSQGQPFIFPDGLPGFPQETRFLPIEVPDQLPLLYLQSLSTPDLCFVALPPNCLVPNYDAAAQPEDLARIGLTPDALQGPGTLCLALLSFEENGEAFANLRAPIVVNMKQRNAVQTIQTEDRYPIRFAIHRKSEASPC